MRSVTQVCPACQSVMPVEGTAACASCGAAVCPETDLHTLITKVPPVVGPPETSESATELAPISVQTPTGPLLAAPKLPDEIGRLGPYRVLARIGIGGMGLVFRAEDPHLRRLVALKVMLPQFTADPTARARFLREARAAAAVEHDHIVPIFQVGEDRGIPYLAMPLLKGEALSARIKARGPLPLFHIVRIAREVADGLAAAHAAGLIHRDIKPSNIMLEGDLRRVRLLDFGWPASSGRGRRFEPVARSGHRWHAGVHVTRSKPGTSRSTAAATCSAWASSCTRWCPDASRSSRVGGDDPHVHRGRRPAAAGGLEPRPPARPECLDPGSPGQAAKTGRRRPRRSPVGSRTWRWS